MQLSGLEVTLIASLATMLAGGGGIIGTKIWDKSFYIPRSECELHIGTCEAKSALKSENSGQVLDDLKNRMTKIEKNQDLHREAHIVEQENLKKMLTALFRGLKIEMPDS